MIRAALPLLLLFTACTFQERPGEEPAKTPAEESSTLAFELQPERPPTDAEALWLEVRIGALPAASTLVIRDEEGETIGAVSPYGKTIREAGGNHLVPLPASMQGDDKITLQVELALPDHEARPPTAEELAELQLVYVPANG